VNERLSTEVAQALEPFVDQNQEWAINAANCIDSHGEDDSEAMFALRLKLARKGLLSRWVSWRQLAEKHPLRAIQIIEAAISTWAPEDLNRPNYGFATPGDSVPNIDDWSEEEVTAIKHAAAVHPELSWQLLMPQIERLTADDLHRFTPRRWDSELAFRGNKSVAVTSGIVQAVIVAGKNLANDNPERLFSLTKPYENTNSSVVNLILAEAFAALHPSKADEGIKWLMRNTTYLSLGSGFHEPRWMPAVRLVQTLSEHCSDSNFEELEAFLINYHDPDEKRYAKHYLEDWKQGYGRYFWGEAQYFLLPALCEKRRSSKCMALIHVLKRKFGAHAEDSFLELGGRVFGGQVVSSIPSNRLEKMSDRAWLKIVKDKSLPLDSGRKWKEIDGHFAESSISYFARDLETIAARYPERFGQLSLQFPTDVYPAYVAAILGSMGYSTPPPTIPEEERSSWIPARYETVEALLARFCGHDDRETATRFCRLLENRADEPWSATTITRLANYASSHPDPTAGRLNVDSNKSAEEVSVERLYQNTINCVRGVAAHALAAWMRNQSNPVPLIKTAIDSLLSDPHPAVRVAAIEVCIARLGVDNDQAVKWFLEAVNDDLRVAASPRASIVFNYAAHSHHSELAPLVRGMLASEHNDVVQQAASEITARWLFYGLFEDELEQCLHESSSQRKGVAEVASHFMGRGEYSTKCRALLERLLDDADTEVLQTVSHAFYNPTILSMPDADSFIYRYINSPAYKYDPSPLLRNLERYTGLLLPYAGWLLAICKVFSGPLREQSRDFQTGISADASTIPSLILRLYEQAHERQDDVTENQCLDAWDMLFENRVGMTRELARSMMQ
jgi:hypothetical protein